MDEWFLGVAWVVCGMFTACLAGLLATQGDDRSVMRTAVVCSMLAWPILLTLMFFGLCEVAWRRGP